MGKVSILMMVYNHASFLKEAIESDLVQEGLEDWELIIGNDASTDESAEIIDEFARGEPRIRAFHHSSNLGLHRNYAFLVEQCQGKYVALLEGDDYWIERTKLKRQFDWMEAHPNAAWCFTSGIEVDLLGNSIKEHGCQMAEESSLEGFLSSGRNPINNSVFYLKSTDPNPLPAFFYQVVQWDFVLHCLRCAKGETIGYLDFQSVHWRRHPNAYTLQPEVEGRRYHSMLLCFRELRKRLDPGLHHHFRPQAAYYFLCGYYARRKKVLATLWYGLLAFPGGSRRDLFYFVRKSLGLTV
jgi:glycosyltransferase involved in cell wall biosynthesis